MADLIGSDSTQQGSHLHPGASMLKLLTSRNQECMAVWQIFLAVATFRWCNLVEIILYSSRIDNTHSVTSNKLPPFQKI